MDLWSKPNSSVCFVDSAAGFVLCHPFVTPWYPCAQVRRCCCSIVGSACRKWVQPRFECSGQHSCSPPARNDAVRGGSHHSNAHFVSNFRRVGTACERSADCRSREWPRKLSAPRTLSLRLGESWTRTAGTAHRSHGFELHRCDRCWCVGCNDDRRGDMWTFLNVHRAS